MLGLSNWYAQTSWLFSSRILGNTVSDYLIALGLLVAGLVAFRLILGWAVNKLVRIADRTTSSADDIFVNIVHSIQPPFYLYLSFYLALQVLIVHPFIDSMSDAVLIIWATYQVLIAAHIFIDYLAEKKARDTHNSEVHSAVGAIKLASKIVLWSLGLLLILSNMGVDITSLVAGLGIGGIAVALAVQSILGDLLSSFAIYFDKPFKIGDFIVMGDTVGTVEKIGIKTTRIRALQGEEIVLPNQQLTSSMIQNYKQMQERRVVFNIGVTYETPLKKVKQIPDLFQKVIESQENTTFDRAHFFSFGDSALNFEVVYHVTVSDYAVYMDVQQAINLGIMEAFEKLEVEFAYPTRTVHITK